MRSMPHIPASLHARPKTNARLAYGLIPFLLVLSAYGLWRWLNIPQSFMRLEKIEIFAIVSFIVIPVVVSIGLAILAAQRVEYDRTSLSYQSRLDQMQRRLNTQEDFVRIVTDYNPESISILDGEGNYWFVNENAAKMLKQDVKDLIGKSPAKVLGIDRARKMQVRVEAVRSSQQAIEALDQVTGDDNRIRFIQTHYQPLSPLGDFAGGVFIREDDITNFIIERERRETMLRQVISALVAVVDKRDPFASGHSQRVGQLSRVIAEEMVLTENEIETAEVAGSLMNFGKVLVPREILTKTSALTAEELRQVRESILTSADILSIIDFVGPVVPTLRQVLERFDGAGAPRGLRGDEIMVTARIVAAANTFVALASPRAHRPSLGFAEAVKVMMKDADTVYDRRVLTALTNCVQNRGDKLEWLRAKPLSA